MLWGQNFFPRNITSSQKRAYITHNFTGKLSLQHVPDSRPRNLSPSQFAYLCVLNLFTLRAWQKMEGSGVETRPFLTFYCVSTEWPKGKFCILANGRCPEGFKRHEGHLKSLYLYSSHSQFVNSAKFGSSSIGCFGSYCGQYGNFIGSLTLITCCK